MLPSGSVRSKTSTRTRCGPQEQVLRRRLAVTRPRPRRFWPTLPPKSTDSTKAPRPRPWPLASSWVATDSNLQVDTGRADLKKVTIAGSTSQAVKNGLAVGSAIAEGQMLARTLINEPGGTLTAPAFARRVEKIARESGVTCKVMDLAAIKKAKLGGLLGVIRGSTNHPRFVELTYKPAGKPKGTLAFVGKGITFDAGGLSIKTGTGMMTMKMDMGGAAAVVGAMSAMKAAGVKSRVRAYIP